MNAAIKENVIALPNSKTLKQFLSVARLMNYQLPGNTNKDLYVIGISGGADSTALAILLCNLFPHMLDRFIFVFTDTMAEAEGTIEAIERFEQFTGVKVTRVSHPDGLYGLVEAFGNFLPSGQNRWCTRILKQEAYEDFMEEIRADREDVTVHSFVGLRADEPGRSGIDSSMPWMRSHFPMRDLGMVRSDVFNVLEETVGIPTFYKFRSRSGCGICPFQRPSEMLGTIARYPEVALKAQSCEKLSERDARRFVIMGQDFSGQHIEYPLPYEMDIRKSILAKAARQKKVVSIKRNKADDVMGDLFGNDTVNVYVGVEYLQDDLMGLFDGTQVGTTGIYHSDLVGWSTTRGGIARKLNTHFHTRLDTAEVWGHDEETFRRDYRQAVIQLEIPQGLIDLEPADSTEKDMNGRLVDINDRPLTLHGEAAYLVNRKYSKAERAALRKQGVTIKPELVLVNAKGQPIVTRALVGGGRSINTSTIKARKHNDAIQALRDENGNAITLNGVQVFRQKKGEVLYAGSFSWRKGEPLAMIRMAASAIKKTLRREALLQQQSQLKRFKGEASWEGEHYDAITETLNKLSPDHGTLVGMEEFVPSESRPEPQSAEEVPCFACSK